MRHGARALPHVAFEPFGHDDARILASWLVDRALLKMTAPDWDHPITAADIRRHYPERLEGAEILKAIADARMVGHLGIRYVKDDSGHLYHVIVNPELRGCGYGSALMRAALRHCFLRRQLHRISLSVFDDNAAAIACYVRAGFRIEGRHMHVMRDGDRRLNTYTMALLRTDWRGE